MKRLLASAVVTLALILSAAPFATVSADSAVTATTRVCSSATTYNIRSSASSSGSLVKSIGMRVSLTVNAVVVKGGSWGPFSCASPSSAATWYRVLKVGSTTVSGYIYAGAVTVAPAPTATLAPVPTPVTVTFTRPAAGTTVRQPSATGNVTWTETGIVTSRAITEFYGPAVAGTCNGVTWTAMWTSTTATSPFAMSGFTLGRCYRFTIVLNGNPAKSASSGNLLITSATYMKNLYDGALVRYQDPDMTACAPTSTQMMLNFIASKGTKGSGFRWVKSTSYTTEENILAWDRAHDTLRATLNGTDPHGWRNGLNYYGWNSYTTTSTMVYQDLAYTSYDAAVKAAVTAMAKFGKPVGIMGWAGSHAQIMNGYEVVGLDPATSSNFSVVAVYLTDPLRRDGLRNARISNANFKGGSLTYRFRAWLDTPYTRSGSPYDDPYTAGTRVSYDEWYGKWNIVAPVR